MGRRNVSIVKSLAISSLLAAAMIPLNSAPSSALQPTPAKAQITCANENVLPPVALTVQDRAVRLNVARALQCLILAEHKSATGMDLRGNNKLALAAFKHADAAESLKWWAAGSNVHVNPQTGSTPDSRIKAEGFCSPKAVARTAEIAYTGYGSGSTARAAFNWWMNSPGHRAIIQNRDLTDYGIGMVPGVAIPNAPSSSNAATYVITFGRCAP